MPPSPIDYFSAFDGWGSGAEALRQLGVSIGEHWASEHPEMNPWAVKTSQALNPNIQHLGPIEGVNPGRFPCKPGLFTAGPPCQDVSIGTPNRQGLSGARSGLFYPTADLWDALGNPHGWFESVASMTPQTRDAISNRLGISPVLLDAGHVGGVSRPRLFWPTFPVKPMEGQGVDPRELIVPDRHLFDPFNEHRTYRLTEGTQGYEKNTSKLWKPMRGWDLPKARAWTRAYGAHGIPYDTVQLEPGGQIWRWTPRAGEMLHGIPEGTMAAAGAPWTEQKKMIGNGWDIPTVKHLLKAYMDHTQPGWDQPVAPQQDRIEIWTPQNNAPVSLAEPTVAPKMVAPAPGSEMFQSPNKPSYAPVGTTFTTERGGSVYTVGENGVTQRNKGASGGVHEGDVGLKPFSERTMYVSPKAANVLSRIYANSPDGPQYNARVNLLPDGQVEYIWYKRGPDGTPKGARTIIPQDMTSFEPKVGMHPVEILPNGSRHIGSPIASVSPPVAPPEPPIGPRTGSIRPNQGGYATPKTLVGTTANLGFPAASAYYDAIQNGATPEQAAKAAAHAGLMGALFSVAYAAAPKLVEPAMGGLIGADATRDALSVAGPPQGSYYHRSGMRNYTASQAAIPTVGGLAGLITALNPETKMLPIAYGMGKLAEPFARPVVQPLMKAATGAYPQEEAAQTRRQFRQQHRAVMPQQPPLQPPRGMVQKPQRPSEVQPGDLTRALMQGRGDAVQEVRPTRRLTPEQEEAIRQHVARLRKYTPPNADRRLLPGGF